MKLIELLARELKEWPKGGEHVVQDDDCDVKFGAGDDPTFDGTMWTRSTEIYRDQWIDVELADDYATAIITREQWEAAVATPTTPALETMLTEWRDLEARAQAAQAEADALFEHAGQLHGEIVVRLAQLGWGAPRGPMVPGEPVVTLDTPLDMTDWHNWQVGDIVKRVRADHSSMMSVGGEGPIVEITDHPTNPVRIDLFYIPNVADLDWVSRPSTQP